MSIRQRILLCRIVEKMDAQREFSRRLGLENRSQYRPKKEKEVRCKP